MLAVGAAAQELMLEVLEVLVDLAVVAMRVVYH